MLAVADHPGSSAVAAISTMELPQGDEGLQVWRNVTRILEDLADRTEIAGYGTSASEPEFDPYVPIRPKRSFYVNTRYVYAGRGKPRPFVWGDD